MTTRKELPVVFMVYGSTYITANVTDTYCRTHGIPMEAPKFILVSLVNLTTTILKDRFLARVFGAKAPGRVPLSAYGLWATRDSLTILAAFILPNRMTDIAVKYGYARKRSEVIC